MTRSGMLHAKHTRHIVTSTDNMSVSGCHRLVMAMFLLGDRFGEAEKRRNFDYYDPLTTRDSSLSSCIQSIVASEPGTPVWPWSTLLR